MPDPPTLDDDAYARWSHEAGFGELRQVLLWRWDPIGAADAFPVAADEYDDYVRALIARLRAGASAEDVAAHLGDVEREAMGLAARDEHLRAIGEFVAAWFERSVWHWAAPGDDAPR